MRVFRRFQNLGQHAAHILGMDEENQRAVRAESRLAEHCAALGLKPCLGFVDVGHFIAEMVLPARRAVPNLRGTTRKVFLASFRL